MGSIERKPEETRSGIKTQDGLSPKNIQTNGRDKYDFGRIARGVHQPST